MWALFKRLWQWILPQKRLGSFSGTVTSDTSGRPTVFDDGKLFIIGNEKKFKWLKFRCPCGCGEVQAINLMQSHQPVWSLEFHEDQTVTIYPSVHALKCGAHFWIRRNQIHWC